MEGSRKISKTSNHRRCLQLGNEEVSLLVSSSKWLLTYGMKALKLDFNQVLSSIGFKNSDDYINILKKPVSSRYANGLFKKVAHKDGTFYNIIGSRDNLKQFEVKLQHVVELYKKRLEWLTTSSRKTFGVIEESRICIIIDIQEKSETQFQLCMQTLISLLKEQVAHIKKLNIMRAASDIKMWQNHCVSVNIESLNDAVSWLNEQTRRPEYSSTSALECILEASKDKQLEAIYLYTDTSLCKSGKEILAEKIKDLTLPIHVVCLNEKHYPNAMFLKTLTNEKTGRFHFYPINGNDLLPQRSSNKNVKGFGVRPDVMLVWEELDQARTVLFDIQSLMADFDFTRSQKYQDESQKETSTPPKTERSTNEMYMSSKQWLKKHGLKKLNLTVYTFLKGLVFSHCDGVLETQRPCIENETSAFESTFIDARYCNKFAHIDWHDGTVKHVHVTGTAYRRFEERIVQMLERYRQRLEWLQKGSRELFGTIIEDRAVILIDTSSSMESRLPVVKEKLLKLFKEQLVNKEKFNVIHFDSQAEAWKDHLVTCNGQNLDAAYQWVKTLQADGSTNTLQALKVGYSMVGVQALYLLTDGRPDQVAMTILSQVDTTIPVHSISFNCDDSEANHFLFELSNKTGGRYHYFSEDIRSNEESPPSYESEDLHLIRSEIEKGLNELEAMHKLHKESLQIELMNRERNGARSARLNGSAASSMTPHKPLQLSARSYVNNKSSLLRMNPISRPQTQNGYFSTMPQNSTPEQTEKKKKKKKKKRSKPSGSEMKRWIHENGIVAQKLTILDALAPTIINQKAKYVPALGKEVLSKVYGEVLPIIHASSGNEREYQIVNPQAVDLPWYEERLTRCLKTIEEKLDNYVFNFLSDEFRERLKSDETKPLSYLQNKEEIDKELDLSGLTSVQKDVELLEKEILQGKLYLKQSEDLRQMVEQLSKEAKEKKTKKSTHEISKIKKKVNKEPTTPNSTRMRYHRVLARSDLDGLYYPALVNKYVNERYVSVCFDNGENQLTSVRYVVSIGGSAPCPSLSVGDYVLVKSNHSEEGCYFYVPGIVQVTPLRMKSSSKCYTVIRYNGTKATALRKDLIKITRTRYVFSTRFIHEVKQPAEDDQKIYDEVIIHDQENDGRHSSSSSSSVRSSRSAHSKRSSAASSTSEAPVAVPIIVKHSPSPAKHDSSDNSSSDESSEDEDDHSDREHSDEREHFDEDKDAVQDNLDQGTTSDSDNDNDITKEETENNESKIKDDLEEWKRNLEEQHSLKIKELEEQKNILLELQEQLKLNEQKQAEKASFLEQQQQQLLSGQQDFLQKQMKLQQEDKEDLKVKYRDLTEMQMEIFKRQQDQQQELLRHLLEKQEQHSEQQQVLQQFVQMKDGETNTEEDAVDVLNVGKKRPISSTPEDRLTDSEPLLDNVLNSDEIDVGEEPEVKVFATEDSEAILIGQGDSGVLLSRNPPDEDPAVVVQKIPAVLKVNQEILARFKDDGWYYRGTIKKTLESNTFVVEDGVGDMEKIIRDDIITDNDDADSIIHPGDCVVALHPRYQYAYAPGLVHGVENDGALKVQFYDSQMAIVPRAEVYLILPLKYQHDCMYIRQCEDALIGQAVVCRDNKTGVFHLGAVRDRVKGPRNYLIEWADQNLDIQNYAYIFGAHTKRQKFEKNSYVLAIFNPEIFSYLPGIVLDSNESNLTVQFCDSNSTTSTVDAAQSFWMSSDYYSDVVKYFKEMNP